MAQIFAVFLLMVVPATAQPKTCGDMKALFKSNACCGMDSKAVTGICPYNFDKPACAVAGVQAPRDLSSTATAGTKTPKIPTLNKESTFFLPLTNVHFHLGAEHKSDNYVDDTASKAYDVAHASGGRRLSENPRPGFMCPVTGLTAAELTPYTFVHCKGDVAVGKSYEFHYVHSSAGSPPPGGVADGLGGAANGKGLLNPYIAVQAQVFLIVNDAATTQAIDATSGGWKIESPHVGAVMYPGSTTGTSHDNSVCSPYAITWHVDKACNKISASAFDKMCHDMKTMFGLDHDLAPHGSRKIVDPAFVVPDAYVKPLA